MYKKDVYKKDVYKKDVYKKDRYYKLEENFKVKQKILMPKNVGVSASFFILRFYLRIYLFC